MITLFHITKEALKRSRKNVHGTIRDNSSIEYRKNHFNWYIEYKVMPERIKKYIYWSVKNKPTSTSTLKSLNWNNRENISSKRILKNTFPIFYKNVK